MKKYYLILLIVNVSFSQTLCWKQVTASYSYHCVGIQTDGTLWSWGFNIDGQLGDGTTANKEVPIQIGTGNNWQSVSNNYSNSFGIKTNGTLWGWGNNSYGQLGIGNFDNKLVPTQIATATNWQSISSGYNYTLAIKTNGTLWAWGDNVSGRLGNGTYVDEDAPIKIGLDTNWAKVCAGLVSSFGIKTDGTLWAWGGLNGLNTDNSPVPVQVGTDSWLDISATEGHAIGLKTNGTIWGWGFNDSGCLGRGNNLTLPTNSIATQIGTANNWKAIGTGVDHSMAIRTNGTLWSWGRNDFGQYGNNSTTDSYVPLQIGTLTNWRSITLGLSFATGFKVANDRLWTWGRDNQDALGNGLNGDSSIPVGLGTCTTLSNIDFDDLNNNFKIYPNPVNEELTIESILDIEIQEIKIIDVLGKIVSIQNNGFNKIEMQNLNKGIYILSILSNENEIFRSKIIKN